MTTYAQTYAQRAMAEGMQQGIQQGMQQGRQEGEAAVLLRLLVRRFGPLGEAITERVRGASPAELERWADNILDARTLDEVFGGH